LSTPNTSRRPRRHYPPTTSLTPDQVVNAPIEYRSFEVRTVGPAIVFVAERDAPLRMEVLSTTHAEQEALREFLHREPRVAELLDTYFHYGEGELFAREDAHADRLRAGRPLPSNYRVTD